MWNPFNEPPRPSHHYAPSSAQLRRVDDTGIRKPSNVPVGPAGSMAPQAVLPTYPGVSIYPELQYSWQRPASFDCTGNVHRPSFATPSQHLASSFPLQNNGNIPFTETTVGNNGFPELSGLPGQQFPQFDGSIPSVHQPTPSWHFATPSTASTLDHSTDYLSISSDFRPDSSQPQSRSSMQSEDIGDFFLSGDSSTDRDYLATSSLGSSPNVLFHVIPPTFLF
jgi:hypothetical protein